MLPAFHPLELAIYYFIAVNFAAFAAFGIDKARAEAGAWRISEATLLGLALIGATPGAYAGRRAFRHKTRKQPFGRQLDGTLMLQIAGAAVLAFGLPEADTADSAASRQLLVIRDS
jgi:uncharacterized membrane protein YsdA (DUF1294 family)